MLWGVCVRRLVKTGRIGGETVYGFWTTIMFHLTLHIDGTKLFDRKLNKYHFLSTVFDRLGSMRLYPVPKTQITALWKAFWVAIEVIKENPPKVPEATASWAYEKCFKEWIKRWHTHVRCKERRICRRRQNKFIRLYINLCILLNNFRYFFSSSRYLSFLFVQLSSFNNITIFFQVLIYFKMKKKIRLLYYIYFYLKLN